MADIWAGTVRNFKFGIRNKGNTAISITGIQGVIGPPPLSGGETGDVIAMVGSAKVNHPKLEPGQAITFGPGGSGGGYTYQMAISLPADAFGAWWAQVWVDEIKSLVSGNVKRLLGSSPAPFIIQQEKLEISIEGLAVSTRPQ